MRCSTVRRRIEAQVDDELDPRRQELLAAHLSTCAACRAVQAERLALRAHIRRALSVAAPADLTGTILAAVRRAPAASVAPAPRRFWRPSPFAFATVAAVVLIVAGLSMIGRDPRPGSGRGGFAPFTRPAAVVILRPGTSVPAAGAIATGGLILDLHP